MVLLIYLLDITFETIIYSVVPLWLIFAGSSRFLMYVITFIFSKWWRKERSLEFISKSEWIQILMFGIISYSSTIIIVVYYFNSGEQEIYLALFSICIFVANIIVLNITSKFSDKRRVEHDNTMLKQQVKLGMDNAIEAASKSDEKRIKIKISNDSNELFILVRNTVSNAVIIEDKSIETTKSNKLDHGFGLKIINTITDKYDGMLKIDCDDKWFTISVLFYK